MKKSLQITLSLALIASLAMADSNYESALQSYNKGDFATSYKLFDELWEKSPENAELNFYLGRSALELKKYDEAAMAFDRVLMVEPKHARTRLEMARIYYETKQFEAANRELDALLGEELPQSIQDVVTQMRQTSKAKLSPHSFRGALMLSLDYDTNIANDVGRGIVQNGFYSLSDKRKSAGFAQIGVFNHTYDIGEKDGWKWENNLLAYNKDVWSHHDRNLLILTLGAGPTYTANDYKISFLGTYDKINLGSDSYLGIGGFSVNLKKMLSSTLIAEADISKKRNLYAVEGSTSDFDSMIYTLGARKSFDNGSWMLSAYAVYKDDKERSDNPWQMGVSKDELGGKIEVSKEIFKGFRGVLGYSYKDISYDEFDKFFNLKRKDKEHYYNVGLNYALDKYSYLLLNYAHTDHNSNNKLYEYTKNVSSITYIRNF